MRKQDYGDGGVYETTVRGKRKYLARLVVDGNQKREYYDTEKEARAAHKRMLKERDAGTLVKTDRITVEVHFTEFFARWKRNKKYGTIVTCQSYFETIVMALGHMPIQKVTYNTIQKLIDTWSENGLAPSTIKERYLFLRQGFRYAVKLGRIGACPCNDEIILPRNRKKELILPEASSLKRLLHTAAHDSNRTFANIVPFTMVEGLRHGEVAALKWSDISFEQMTVTVQRSSRYIQGRGMCEESTKNEASTDTIPLFQVAREALERQRTHVKELRLKAGDSRVEQGYVFPNRVGGILDRHSFHRQWASFCKRQGLSPMRFHLLRHIAGSLYIRETGNWQGAQKLLRHGSMNTTRNVYAHLFADSIAEDVAKLNRAYNHEAK